MEYPTPDVVDCQGCGRRMWSFPDNPKSICGECDNKRRAELSMLRRYEAAFKAMERLGLRVENLGGSLGWFAAPVGVLAWDGSPTPLEAIEAAVAQLEEQESGAEAAGEQHGTKR